VISLTRDGLLPGKVLCAHCGTALDPSRAARVRFSAEQQLYFCSPEHADGFSWSGFRNGELAQALDVVPPSPPKVVVDVAAAGMRVDPIGPDTPQPVTSVTDAAVGTWPVALGAGAVAQSAQPVAEDPAQSSVEQVHDGPSLPPPRPSPLAWAAFGPIVVLGGTTLLAVAQEQAFWAQLTAICVLTLAQLVDMHNRQDKLLGDFPPLLSSAAEFPVRVARPSSHVVKPSSELRSGEEVVVGQGEIVPVDGVITVGGAIVVPWHGAKHTESVVSGRRMVAGARVVSGELVIVATKTGAERAFHVSEAFVRDHGQFKMAGWASWVWGPSLGLVSCLLLRLQGLTWVACVAAGMSVCATFVLPGALRRAHGILRRSWAEAAERGIAYCDAQVFERAGQVNSAVFCARGSVLSGEPDVAEIHVWRGATEEKVLAIAAGAESAVHHPIASATIRAAHHRQVSVDACRGHHVSAGLGVTCSSSEGRAVVVGSRELLLRERISVAIAEEKLRMLEARGNSTLLVAVDGRLIGVLGLQDTLRAGARAAFQLLLDHKLEPILLSGDARATTEAVARSLGCEHVRPEVPALARAREVRSLIDSGLVVAVVGNSPRDDVALGAASVPIILEGAAMVRSDSPHGHERGIGLAGDRVIDATSALLIAKQARNNLQVFLACWLLLGTLGSALVVSQLAPLFMAPILGLIGVKVGSYLARKSANLPG